MKSKGLSPKIVILLGTFSALAFLVASRVAGNPGVSAGFDWSSALGEGSCSIAYLIGLVSCWRAAISYPKRSPIRLGWLAMGGNCFLSLFRHLALNPLFAKIFGSQDRVFFASQTLQLPALILVLLGMAALWWGVYRLRLGFRVGWLNYLGIGCAAVLVAWASRGKLSLAHEEYGGLSIIQDVSLGLLVAIGGVSLLLHGLAIQMGGGRLAVVMRWIAVYALLRSTLTLTQGWRESYSLFWWLAFFSVPWLFSLSAAYACWLTDSVKRGMSNELFPEKDLSRLAH